MPFATHLNRGLSAIITASLFLAVAAPLRAASPEDALPEETGWFRLSPSTRPAYVGIHGGTAPITLFRGPDGSVYAFTGQTGNDFILAIRNGNASNRHNAPAGDEDAGPLSADDALLPDETDFYAALLKQSTASPDKDVYGRWSDSARWLSVLAAETAMACRQETSSDDIVAPKPENYPDVVFTTGEAAGKLALSRTDLSPFGLSAGDMPLSATAEPPFEAFRPATPLRLHDYRTVLNPKP